MLNYGEIALGAIAAVVSYGLVIVLIVIAAHLGWI